MSYDTLQPGGDRAVKQFEELGQSVGQIALALTAMGSAFRKGIERALLLEEEALKAQVQHQADLRGDYGMRACADAHRRELAAWWKQEATR